MTIGIVGAGMIGAAAARVFAAAGHEVALSNSRGPDSLADVVASIGARARALSVDEAARFGDVVLLAELSTSELTVGSWAEVGRWQLGVGN